MPLLLILLTEGFADWECAPLMGLGREQGLLEVETASPGGGPIVSLGGLRVTPDLALEAADPARHAALVIPGGSIWARAEAPDLAGPARAFLAAGRPVAAICDAVLALGRAGLLDRRAHTGNFPAQFEGLAGYAGGAFYRDQPRAVSEGGVITAAGTAPVSFMLAVAEAVGQPMALWREAAEYFAAEHRAG